MARRRSSRGVGEGMSSPARRPVEESELRKGVANLATVDLAGLRLQWRNVFGGAAPLHLPKPLLARILAYRLQADALGDLSDTVRRTLEGTRSSGLGGQAGGDGSSYRRRIKPGSILVREWNGHLQRVTALEESFAWEGKTYRSLSMVARAITGGHWNGPRFFGLAGSKTMGRAAVAIASTEVQTSRVDKGRRSPHEATTGRTIVVCNPVEAMRGLYPGLDRPRTRTGLQFRRRPVRSLRGFYSQPGS